MFSLLMVALAAATPPPGEIAFVGGTPGASMHVHIVSTAGGAPRVVGPDNAEGPPSWSPDGARLAVAVREEGGSRIYVCNADGTGGHFLNHAQRSNHGPVWSPDGTRLAYTAGSGLDAQIIVASADIGVEAPWGGGRTSLVNPMWVERALVNRVFERIGDGHRTAFLPPVLADAQGSSLLIAVGLVGAPGALTTDLFLVSETEATAFTEELLPSAGTYEEFAPSATRDGVAFESNDGADREIFIVTGRGARDLSNNAAADWRPVWSPDGKWIAFESFRRGTRGIYRCQQSTSRVLRVVSSPDADCWDVSWSPDSGWLAYTTDKDGPPAIWTIRADGEDATRLTPEGLSVGLPAWRPRR